MISIPKIQLSKISPLLLSISSILHLVSLFLIFKKSFIFVLSVYFLLILSVFLIYQKNKKRINLLEINEQDLLEKNNLLQESIRREKSLIASLDKRNSRYASLKHVLDKFNLSLNLDEVGKVVTEETFNLFGGDYNVLLYLINKKTNGLEILFSKRSDPDLIIKEKNGDLFDAWVLRRNQALLVEDANKDFRFDPEQIKKEISRSLGSVIIAPLVAADRFIGILRVESPYADRMTSEDLRFLSTISNLSAVSLENSLLYNYTQELAKRDSLTGLYLRRYLDERGNEEVSYAFRQKYELSVLMLDIDNFKSYNDKFGHHFGDIVLTHVADLLKGIFHKQGCMVSRFGGEEFVILLTRTKKAEAIKLAQDLRLSIQNGIIFLRRQPVKITVSIGVASYPKDVDSWVELIKNSDAAMYKAKQQGRNKVCWV